MYDPATDEYQDSFGNWHDTLSEAVYADYDDADCAYKKREIGGGE